MTNTHRLAILTDQKLLNEELIACIVEVAAINVQHCADLFEIPYSLIKRIRDMSRASHAGRNERDLLQDLAMTPAPLWCFALTVSDVRRMLAGPVHMFASELEPYRPIVGRLNRLVVGMLVRYASDPVRAALVCGVSNPALFHYIQEAACATLLDVASHAGRPLIDIRLSHAMLDRFFMTIDGTPAQPALRGLVAMLSVCSSEYSALQREEHAPAAQAVVPFGSKAPQLEPRRSGKAPAILLNPSDSKLVVQMLAHRVKPCDIERFLPDRGVRALQIERLKSSLFPRTKEASDAQQVWASATRRMHATVVMLKHKALIGLGLNPTQALVEAFDFHARHHAGDDTLSLPRLLKDVVAPMQDDDVVRFNYCSDCGLVHLTNEERSGPLDCPACCLVYRKKLGHKRRWKNYMGTTEQQGQRVAA